MIFLAGCPRRDSPCFLHCYKSNWWANNWYLYIQCGSFWGWAIFQQNPSKTFYVIMFKLIFMNNDNNSSNNHQHHYHRHSYHHHYHRHHHHHHDYNHFNLNTSRYICLLLSFLWIKWDLFCDEASQLTLFLIVETCYSLMCSHVHSVFALRNRGLIRMNRYIVQL